METGKRGVCGIKWKAAAVHCLHGGSHKRALQAFGTGAAFLCHLLGFAATEGTVLSAMLCPMQF